MEQKSILHDTITNQSEMLRDIIISYVIKFGLATYDQAPSVAQEILQETVLEGLKHMGRFDPNRDPIPWLLGIAINRIRMRQRGIAKSKEILIQDYNDPQNQLSNDALFQKFADFVTPNHADAVEQKLWIEELLSHISGNEREIIHLAIWHDLDSQAIGKQLDISASAVRVRLHRAIKKLRQWIQLKQEGE